MLTSLPTYDACEALANAAVASIQQAFPALEARFNNSITEGPLVIQARNPLNGDCWAIIGTVGPTVRNPANIEVLIGGDPFGNPAARFTGNAKKMPDSATVCRTVIEYVTRERTKQEKQIVAQQAFNASNDAAKQLTQRLKKAGLPVEGDTPHLIVAGRHESSYLFREIPSDKVALVLRLEECVVTPEAAAKFLKLWKPLGKLLAEQPSLKPKAKTCPAAGTLVN